MIKNHNCKLSKGINFISMTKTQKVQTCRTDDIENRPLTKLLEKRNHSPLRNHKSQRCSKVILAQTLNSSKTFVLESRRQQMNDGYIKQVKFRQMSQPQGDSNMSIISVTEDNIDSEAETVQINENNKPKTNNNYFPNFKKQLPILQNSIIEEYSSERERQSENSNEQVQLLRQENKELKQRTKKLERDLESRNQLFDCLLKQVNELKGILKKFTSVNEDNDSGVPSSYATNIISRLEYQQSRQMIAQDIHKKLRLIQSINNNE